ncbi:undecaprenyl-diphosphate phosphatase [Oceanirhabdus sp. W0125-5]|uniref:undecaprenyl-diphosphate phosphatase n=1 Tax=Oceanirhabdus sp. W0125-5 TaxID=2999116 RepID=UPI0022F2F90F|nr:undecaprenyl-diphosphate phosphatase [Oceanirhabdus sp. W0125-5]WBW98700.1 undecaprenyl-diphosphate phosphatase [Oceanirhabdus sp. W0125-5]
MELFMTLIKAIIISIVEGITEFLPVSSTGHMIIVRDFINFDGAFSNLFIIVIQLGAILAIVVLFWNKIYKSVISFLKLEKEGLRFWLPIFVACIPAVILGLLFDDKIEAVLFKPLPVGIALIVGAILMIVLEKSIRDKKVERDINHISYKQAIIIGIAQCMALWPGMSRSASTIMGGWVAGLSTYAATEFSFFLALPVMVGATGYKLLTTPVVLSGTHIFVLIVGFIAAFLVALIVVDKFLNYLKKKPMKVFSIYRLIVGVIIVVMYI